MEAGVRANALCLYSTTFNLRLVLVAIALRIREELHRSSPSIEPITSGSALIEEKEDAEVL